MQKQIEYIGKCREMTGIVILLLRSNKGVLPIDKITLTPLEAANTLGISRTTIYLMIRNNEIPHSRIRGKIVFHKDKLNEWLADGGTKG